MNDSLPKYADTVVIGGGTAGAAIAGELAAHSAESVLLLEAGPDYGPFAEGRWPVDLTDARAIPVSHDWGYDSGQRYGRRVLKFERARVIGGCSAHNGCAAIWGSRLDYDHWAALGNPGWSTEEMLPLLQAGSERLRVRIPDRDEITPYQLAWLDAAPHAGIPIVEDLNNLDENIGMGRSPANIAGGVRWNAAFAYLDPVRSRTNLTIAGNALTDRLQIRNGRVDAVRIIRNGREQTVEAGRVVLAAGTYGSPAILLRSGVGDPPELRSLGITSALDLPGVGRNLHDHPVIGLVFTGTRELEAAMAEFARHHWTPDEQTIAKARSSRCASGFDLHMYPVGGVPAPGEAATWNWWLAIACMTPRSRGALKLSSPGPESAPILDHGYLSDPEEQDLRILIDGIHLARQLASEPNLRTLLGNERWLGNSIASTPQIADYIRKNIAHYYHPVGTCMMGPAGRSEAVVDSNGRIHGLDNCYVGDASIIPVIPRANTNLPALATALQVTSKLPSPTRS